MSLERNNDDDEGRFEELGERQCIRVVHAFIYRSHELERQNVMLQTANLSHCVCLLLCVYYLAAIEERSVGESWRQGWTQ